MALFERSSSLASTLTNSQRSKGCVTYDPRAIAPTYGYDPSLAAGIVFTVVFFLSMLHHIWQTVRSRKWWYSALALGAFGEGLGWAGRAAAHHCPYNKTFFSLQISILIICKHSIKNVGLHTSFRLIKLAPCFFSAACYYILGEMIKQYGRRYSPFSSTLYLVIFISFDLVSIIIQAIGGGMASKAGGQDPPGNTAPGTHVMMAGIIIQLVSMSVFALLWLAYLWRAHAVGYSKTLVVATTFAAFCIVVRNFYRSVELSQGWKGYLITHEVYFAVLDGALMALAVLVFNIFFPAKYVSGTPELDSHGQPMAMSKEAPSTEGV